MKKGKSITLLTILSILMACLLVITFARFEVGVYNFNSALGAIELDYDIGGGRAYVATLAKDNIEEVGDKIDDVIKTVENRMEALGYSVFSVKAVKSIEEGVVDYDLVITAKAPLNSRGISDVDALTKDVNVAVAFGELEFYGDAAADPGEDKKILTDMNVIADAVCLDSVTRNDIVYYPVKITFTKEAFDEISKLLRENNDKYYLKIMLGSTVVMNASTEGNALNSSYFDGRSLQITIDSETAGSVAAAEAAAKQTALQIKSGGLAYKYELDDSYDVSAPVGENVPLVSAIAIAVLIVLIIVALIVLYKIYGVVFSLSLIIFICLEIVMLIAVPGIKLSLGGIVGILLSTLVVCDGFIITIKRIKEEFERGKTLKSAVKVGYKRALLPIISIGVIAGVVALAVFAFASGSLRCFGITFGIGVVLGVVINLLITRMYSAILLSLVNYNEKAVNFKRTEE